MNEFPPSALREYALIADGERGALCGPHGDLAWLCAPQWHDDAVFSTLIGGRGVYAVTPVDRSVWGGHYEPGTLIWRNRWATDTGALVECRDALAMPADKHRVVVLRRVQGVDGTAIVRVVLDARAEFDARPMRDLARDGTTWTATCGPLRLRWTGAADASVDAEGRLVLTIRIAAGETHDLVLEFGEQFGEQVGAPPLPAAAWQSTERAWHESVPSVTQSAAPRDATHAYAVLRGLTSGSGGMVAAATMSLPERADTSTSYDYRYSWIRDQCFAGLAVAALGPHPLLTGALDFVSARLHDDGPDLRPAYLVTGGDVPGEKILELDGYPGGTGVLGNHVNAQFQLDAFGEALQLFAAAARHDVLESRHWRAATLAVHAIEQRWDEPDAGIWELDDDWWTQSRLSCVAGLYAAAGVAPRRDAHRMRALGDTILTETARRCLHAGGYWQRRPGDERVDAALLLPTLRGATPAGDPRTRATLEAVRRDLIDDGYVYRYRPESAPLGHDEGAFLLCGFVLALAEAQRGDPVAAFRAFERNRAACGPPGLLSEEFDVAQRQLRGNLPQAFVHAALLESSIRLADEPYR